MEKNGKDGSFIKGETMPGKKPTKEIIAQMKVMSDMGETPYSIAKQLGTSNHTVKKYLDSSEIYDLETQELIKITREQKIENLTAIWTLAANKVKELIKGEKKLIPLIAAMDRSFQQLRLLQN